MKNKTKSTLLTGTAALLTIAGQAMISPTASATPIVQNQPSSFFSASGDGTEKKRIATVETQELNTVLDIPLRIGGFVITAVGTALFIGTSPFTGLMSAVHPHDAMKKTANFLVVRPAYYTFIRPVGDFNYELRSYNER